MNTQILNRKQGFTIIELMIVLVIVAILLAFAYPSYVNYVRKANRGEAQQALMNWSVNQEIWRANNPSYNGSDSLKPTNDKYTFSVVAGTNDFTLSATAQGDQAKDKARNGTPCTVLNLRSDGRKYSGNDPDILDCWE